MVDSHVALGIAQTVFYLPVLPAAFYLLFFRRSHWPRALWLPLVLLSCMRFAGGPVAIALERNPTSSGLIIAVTVLLNVGVIPLLVQALRLFMVVLSEKDIDGTPYPRLVRGLWLLFCPAISLLCAGPSVGTDHQGLERTLTLIGYLIFAAILILLLGMELHVWRNFASLSPRSRRIVLATLLSGPFLIVRNLYGILELVFQNDAHPIWNPVSGSAVLFGIMGLLMEYVVVCNYFWIGFSSYPAFDPLSAA